MWFEIEEVKERKEDIFMLRGCDKVWVVLKRLELQFNGCMRRSIDFVLLVVLLYKEKKFLF